MQTKFPKLKLVLFALLSATDFAITYFLISGSKGAVYEANPVADQSLQRWGWTGLAVFKATLVTLITTIVVYIYYRRPRVAHDVLAVACGAVVVAVLTGTSIAINRAGAAPTEEFETADLPVRPARPAETQNSDYLVLLDHAAYRLAANRVDLANAVASVEKADKAKCPAYRAALRKAYPGLEDRALVAADLLQHTVGGRVRSPLAAGLAERLEQEFKLLYGSVPTLPYRQMLFLSQGSTEANAVGHAESGPRVRAE